MTPLKHRHKIYKQVSFLLSFCVSAMTLTAETKPNVILVMTDDQGYGDLGCHGNSILKTPELDRLHAESVRFTDFHVSPFCTPTRAALMTGNHPGYTGAYRTSSGRSLMHADEKTVADLFASAGYVTGMAGKWHLGDNAPHRPQDRGFQDVVWHRCGGIGQASDYWGNDYFDDTYAVVKPGSRVEKFEKFEGYCTDVFFRECMRFVGENKDKPFFYYLALNAPHGPYYVAPEWAAPYKGIKNVANPNFYGMIANFDHNMGLLRKNLEEQGLAENTILIFMTDNGTSAGAKFKGLDSEALIGYNAGMRGKKSSVYDGGHRVPFFIHWPKGGLTGGKDIETIGAHIDVLPTLAELCGIKVGEGYDADGISLKPLLDGSDKPWKREHHVVQYHGGAHGAAMPAGPLAFSVVLTERWRLVNSNGQFLFDIEADPAQREDVSGDHPEVVKRLRALYDPFWEKVSPRLTPVRIDVGDPGEPLTALCSQDWFMDKGNPPWNFGEIRRLPRKTGPWMLDVKRAGRYRLTLRQWPAEANKPVIAVRAKVEVAGKEQSGPVTSGCKAVVVEMDLPAGPAELKTYLYDKEGKAGGAYFTDVEWLGESAKLPKPAEAPQSVVRATESELPKAKAAQQKFDFKAELKGKKSWETHSFAEAAKMVWDGVDLSGMTLTFSAHNFGYNDSMKKVNFSGSTLNTTGNQPFINADLNGADFSGAIFNIKGHAGKNMTAFRDAKLTGANFSGITWGESTEGLMKKTDFFFSGGPGSTSVADKDLAVTFEGADLSLITGVAKISMIKNLGKLDGKTPIGAKYDASTLAKSGWKAAELDAAGWQSVK
ncbi:MAG: sulfatase-like hydrolase/transferase [Akkermansiaceae bacterium]